MVSDKTPEVLQKKRDVSEKNIRQWFDSVKEYAEVLLKVKKDMKRKEAIEKRIKRRQDMNKNKKQFK